MASGSRGGGGGLADRGDGGHGEHPLARLGLGRELKQLTGGGVGAAGRGPPVDLRLELGVGDAAGHREQLGAG